MNIPVSITMRVGGPEPNNPQTIYYQAVSFYFAGDRCLLSLQTGPKTTQCLVVPSIVNFVFSIELFLKSILIKHGMKVIKTHKIAELIKACPENLIDKVKNEYYLTIKDPKFDQIILIVNNMFVQVRYQYEYEVNGLYDSAVIALAQALYVICEELYKL